MPQAPRTVRTGKVTWGWAYIACQFTVLPPTQFPMTVRCTVQTRCSTFDLGGLLRLAVVMKGLHVRFRSFYHSLVQIPHASDITRHHIVFCSFSEGAKKTECGACAARGFASSTSRMDRLIHGWATGQKDLSTDICRVFQPAAFKSTPGVSFSGAIPGMDVLNICRKKK